VPVFFECQRCAACCRWRGEVRPSEAEITRLADYKGLSEGAFIEQFTRLTYYRHGLALKEKPNGECVFLEGRDCTVQSVKPQQCRNFPSLWRMPGFEWICPAVPRQVSPAEWERLVEEATGLKPPFGEAAQPATSIQVLPVSDAE
jgi:Fe-S-cluster containining protein